jgi:hypothetical protein
MAKRAERRSEAKGESRRKGFAPQAAIHGPQSAGKQDQISKLNQIAKLE